jgi:sugar/nucleoside kinase (ribokinase family)
MSLLVVGTLAFDTVETPHGRVERVLGGSATFFAAAASFFTPVRLVSVIGSDFGEENLRFLRERGIDVEGVVRKEGPSFTWSGRYEPDMNQRETLDVQLNVYADFQPVLPKPYRDSRYVFLANGSPESQLSVLGQLAAPQFVVADTMNLWIDQSKGKLLELLKKVDLLVLNDDEARQLSGRENLVAAAEAVLALGPRAIVVKKGEHGAFLLAQNGERFAIPAYPVSSVKDPTGAGDSFAGGIVGYLAHEKASDTAALRRAMVYGTVMASFVVEQFSLDGLRGLTRAHLDGRYREFVQFITV